MSGPDIQLIEILVPGAQGPSGGSSAVTTVVDIVIEGSISEEDLTSLIEGGDDGFTLLIESQSEGSVDKGLYETLSNEAIFQSTFFDESHQFEMVVAGRRFSDDIYDGPFLFLVNVDDELTRLAEPIASLVTGLSNHTTQIASIEANYATLQTTVSNQTTDLDTKGNQIQDLLTRVGVLENP